MDKATNVSSDDSFILTQCSTLKVDKTTMVSLAFIHNSPEKCRLRKRIEFLKKVHAKKMRTAQQKVHRYNDQVTTLKSALDRLKHNQLLNETQADMIHVK